MRVIPRGPLKYKPRLGCQAVPSPASLESIRCGLTRLSIGDSSARTTLPSNRSMLRLETVLKLIDIRSD